MALWEHKSKAILSLLAASAMALAACGDSDSNNGGIGAGNAGGISALPPSIIFEQVELNGEGERTVTIQSTGEGTLSITDMHLREESGGQFDNQREFHKGEGWTNGEIRLEPGETKRFSVIYRPLDQTSDQGRIVFETNDPDKGEFPVNISTQDLSPQISGPDNISFRRVPPQTDDPDWEGDQRPFRISNAGAAPLDIRDVYVSGSDRFRVTFPQPTQEELDNNLPADPENDIDQWPTSVAPGENFPVRVWFKPDDNLPETGELVFQTNDPDNSEYVINLSGNSDAPCLQVSLADEINFGQSSLGQTAQKTVTMQNCSRSSNLEVSEIAITDDGGGVFALQDGSLPGDLPADMAVIPPGERANFVVTFEPAAEESYEGELIIKSNDEAAPSSGLPIPIRGEGTDNACPRADAKAWIQGTNREQENIQTIPLNTIQFDGSASTDQDGSIDRYEWTVLSRPQGSTQRLLPNNGVAQPRLFLDLAGTYEVELKVYDDQGAASCGDPAVITIVAVPEDDVHVQLVWDTPSDPDQTDAFGTDLDLHYLHPNGRWDDPPWDIFWRNPTADWGTTGNSADDPRLDIDDTDGAGPENVNHSGLENLDYRTGVYYYSDNTLGASYATMRIYVRGVLEMEVENKYMPRTGSFWDVGLVSWPSGNVTPVSRMYQGFPGAP